MRRTRSNSVADTDMSKRSLRSTHNEDFYEIPTIFRVRSPRAAPEANILEKSPTRRSLRLQSEDSDSKDVAKNRKRRLHSSPGNKAMTNGVRKSKEEYETKPSKVLRSEDEESSSSLHPKNGVHSRTRQKHEGLEVNGTNHTTPIKKEVKSPRTTNSHTCPKSPTNEQSFQNDEYANFSPRRTRNSPRCLRSSQGEYNANGISSTETHADSPKTNSTPRCNNKIKEKVSRSRKDSEETNNCECHSDLNKTFPISKNQKCEYCNKLQSFSPRKNGIINGSANKSDTELSPRSLRSSTHATTASSLSTIKCAGSPMAAEEASEREHSKPPEDESISSHLRGSRRKSERDVPEDLNPDSSKKKEESDSNKENSEVTDSVQVLSTSTDKSVENSSRTENSKDKHKASTLSEYILSNRTRGRDSEGDKVISDTQSDHGIRDLKRSGSPTVFDEISCQDFDFISDNESDYSSYNRKKRKMNLRSSGVRCDPDFYTLSLDLLIKRPHRRSNLLSSDWTEAGIKSEKNDIEKKDDLQIDVEDSREPTTEMNTSDRVQNSANQEIEKSPALLPPETENITQTSVQSLFTVKQDSPLDFLKIAESRESNRSRSSSPCSSSTPRRGPTATVLHKLSRGGPRGPRGLSNTKLDRSPSVKIVAKDPSEPPPLFTEEPPSGPDVYYFESDHVALKHNRDYHTLLHTVSILESQRHRCLSDIKTLEGKRLEALDEPVEFVEKLQKKVDLDFPSQQNVPELPDIDWSKYSSVYGTFDQVFRKDILASPKKIVTRKVKINFQTGVPMQQTEQDSSKVVRRGSQGNRSQSFRVAWTVEEQRKLEELLLKYPSEEIEFNRYRKIAAELDNRTAMQVQSRVQKYFIKLAKAGLPIPGHMPRIEKIPKSGWRNRRARSHPHQQLTRMSTFFPRFHVPVRMTDDQQDNNNEDEEGWTIDKDQVSDEEDVPHEMRFSDEYLEILRLKRIRRERLRVFDNNGQQALAQHVGFECDMCNCDPIQGVRYHCIDCPTDDGVDLCQSCIRLQGQFETAMHKTTHRMEPVYKSESFVDDDYLKFVSRSGDYNYLDPNFFPPKT